MSIPTLAALNTANITFTGTTITILFRDRDRLASQTKQIVSSKTLRPVQFIFQTKDSIRHEWWFRGFNHNPFGAAVFFSDSKESREYHNISSGQLGCNYGPAQIEHQYGIKYLERWVSDNGNIHRDDGGPAYTEVNYTTPADSGFNSFQSRTLGWYHNNENFRKDSWKDTWSRQIDYHGNEMVETIPPMGIIRTLKSKSRELSWHDENGELHRTDGPASLRFKNLVEIEKNERMAGWQWEDWSGRWYIHGEEILYSKILDWSQKNHIPMWNEPCYNRSAFRDETGEFCFLTDFVGV